MQSVLWEANQPVWEAVTMKLNHAVVYMDSGSSQLLHWSGGMGLFLSSGALDIRELSSFESADPTQKKGVFVTCSLLHGLTEQIIHDIVTQSQFQYVVVITTVSPLLHASTSRDVDERAVFTEFENSVLEWMGNMNYTVEVMHIPLFSAMVCPGFFLAPSFSELFPLMNSDVRQIVYQYTSSHNSKEAMAGERLEFIECTHLPESLQLQYKMLASGLHALLQNLDVREDVYSIGHTSRIIATELESYPPARARRKACQNKASLILIDRTLDIGSAVSHQMDSLLDRLVNILPRLPGNASDCLVDMQALCHVIKSSSTPPVILPGSLCASDFSHPPTHLLPLVTKRQKEAVMDVNRKLVETAAAEKLPLNLSTRPGRVTADQIDSTVALFRGKYALIQKHLDTLQVAMATSQALSHPSSSHVDSLVAAEKNLVQTIAEDMAEAPSGFSVIARLILQEMARTEAERELTLEDILCLILYLFSLVDDEAWGSEAEAANIQEQLVKWIIKDQDNLPPLVRDIVGDKVSETILTDQVDSVWEKLVAVGKARAELTQFRSVVDHGDDMTPASVNPLLRQIMEKIVDPAKPELTDVECKSGGLKDLLKSGFGLFKASSKPRPGDSPLLILFVIGGVTASEVKQVRDVVNKAKPGFEVLIGSTRLASIDSILKSVLVDDNINFETL